MAKKCGDTTIMSEGELKSKFQSLKMTNLNTFNLIVVMDKADYVFFPQEINLS